jgi:hypothetical protein
MKKKITTIFSRILVALLAAHSVCTFAGTITIADAKKRMVAQLIEAGFDQELSNEITHEQTWESKSNDGLIDEQVVKRTAQDLIAELNGISTASVASDILGEKPTITLQQAITESAFRLFSRGFHPDFDAALSQNIVDRLIALAGSYGGDDITNAYVLTRAQVNTIFKEEIDKFDEILKPHIVQSSLPSATSPQLPTSPRTAAQPVATDIVRVVQQRGVTCGYHTVFNAYAVQELVRADQQVTSEAVQEIAQKYHPLIDRTDYELFYHELLELAQEVGLTTFHIIAYNEPIKKVYDAANSADVPEDLNAFFAKLVSEKTPVAHLLCNTGGHWIALSVIHRENGDAQIIYLDSMNPKSLGNASRMYINYVQDNLTNASKDLQPVVVTASNVVDNPPSSMPNYRNALFGTALGLSAAFLAHKFMR